MKTGERDLLEGNVCESARFLRPEDGEAPPQH